MHVHSRINTFILFIDPRTGQSPLVSNDFSFFVMPTSDTESESDAGLEIGVVTPDQFTAREKKKLEDQLERAKATNGNRPLSANVKATLTNIACETYAKERARKRRREEELKGASEMGKQDAEEEEEDEDEGGIPAPAARPASRPRAAAAIPASPMTAKLAALKGQQQASMTIEQARAMIAAVDGNAQPSASVPVIAAQPAVVTMSQLTAACKYCFLFVFMSYCFHYLFFPGGCTSTRLASQWFSKTGTQMARPPTISFPPFTFNQIWWMD